MKKVLPVCYPMISSYPEYAAITASMGAYTHDVEDWVFQYFIQLELLSDHCYGMRVDYDVPSPWAACPWINYYKLSREVIQNKWDTVIDFVIEMISAGFYLYCLADTFYLKLHELKDGPQEHFLHDLFVYGFDQEQHLLYVADNFHKFNDKYTFSTCSFKEFDAAYTSATNGIIVDWLQGVRVFSYNRLYDYAFYDLREKFTFEYNVPLIKQLLQDYIDSFPTKSRWPQPKAWRNTHEHIFGRNVYLYLSDHLDLIKNGTYEMDEKGFAVLIEHKRVMTNRFLRLEQLGYITLNREEKDALSNLESMAEIMLSLSIKYKLLHQSKFLTSLKTRLQVLDELECRLLTGLINRL